MILVILLISAWFDWILYQRLIRDEAKNAERHARAVATIVQQITQPRADGEAPTLREVIGVLSRQMGDIRITVFASDGNTVVDSAAATLPSQNPDDPPQEILEALADGIGVEVRHRADLDTSYVYAAVADNTGGDHISRVAIPLDDLQEHQAHVRAMFGFSGLATVLIVATLLYQIGRRGTLAARVQGEKARLEALVQARTSVLTELRALGSTLAVCNDLDEAAQAVGVHMPRLLPARGGALALVNASRNLIVVRHEWGSPWPHAIHCPPSDCWALRKSAVHESRSAETGLICKHLHQQDDNAVTCIPLIAHGEALGVIHVIGPDDVAPDGGQAGAIDVERAVAEEVAVALSNIQLRETLKQQALRDALTGLYNRRFLEEHFAYETARAARHEKPLALLIIDVDHFKNFNDTFGHDAGDHVLSRMGEVLRASMRGEDVVCRLGGEEFAAILPETGSEGALEFAEKMRGQVAAQEFTFMNQSLGPVTISVGIAIYPEHGEDLTGLLKSGDEALYAAKEGGRNRVCIAGDAF